MRVFVMELGSGKLREQVNKKLIAEIRNLLCADELVFLQTVAQDNKKRLTERKK